EGRYLPPWDLLPCENANLDLDVAQGQVSALRALAGRGPTFVALPATALLQPVLAPEGLEEGKLALAPGMEMTPVTLTARLLAAGFDQEDVVEAPGQFARRGGIVDVFPFFAERPLRVEFFGDEVDTLRWFDSVTQTSERPLRGEVTVIDINRDSFAAAYARGRCPLTRYLKPGAAVFLFAPEKIADNAALYYSGFIHDNPLFPWERMAADLAAQPLVVAPEFADSELSLLRESCDAAGLVLPAAMDETPLGCEGLSRRAENLDVATAECTRLRAAGAAIAVFCRTPAERQRLRELLAEKDAALAGAVDFRLGTLSRGF
ncbi:MAG: hypothetical protein J6333_05190, partial [Planctomycetes bacterium]|nr:hypothetical protein [Planctomycetota bacterium]